HAPQFTSVPVVTVLAGQQYKYQNTAFDADSDYLRFDKITGPSLLSSLNSMDYADHHVATLTWLTTTADVGMYSIRLRVSDLYGGYADQSFVLSVVSGQEWPPVITSTPVVAAYVNTAYTYQATATDQDADPLTFSIPTTGAQPVPQAPAGMTANAAGLVTWTPTAAQLGTQSVSLKVSDTHGNSMTQVYNVLVLQKPGNHPPIFISTAPPTTPATELYLYPSKAIDPDGDIVTYSLTQAPTGMSVSAGTGMIAWQTTSASAGNSYPVTVQASDGNGGLATQSFTVTVTSAPPSAPGTLEGTKYADLNNNGVRDANYLYPPPSTLQAISLQEKALAEAPVAIAYDPLINAMLLAVSVSAAPSGMSSILKWTTYLKEVF